MATNIGELLDGIGERAQHATADNVNAHDALAALGELGDILRRLAVDLVAPADDLRNWSVPSLAAACTAIAQRPPAAGATDDASRGRITQLAAASAEAVTLQRHHLTADQRWAVAVAATDAIHELLPLTVAAAAAERTTRQHLAVLAGAANAVSQLAAIDPPAEDACKVLDRPIPNPFPPERASVAQHVNEAAAGLLYWTRPGTGPHTIADVLAITLAAETVCRTAATLDAAAGHPTTSHFEAATAWRDVRSAMDQFNDGSRRRQTQTPNAVGHALRLHRWSQQSAASVGRGEADGPKVDAPTASVVTTVLPQLADHAITAVLESVQSGRWIAYACDLPLRESRVSAHLAGYRHGGLICADVTDVAPVLQALLRAQDPSTITTTSATDRAANTRMPARAGMSHELDLSARSASERAEAARHADARAASARYQPTAGPRR